MYTGLGLKIKQLNNFLANDEYPNISQSAFQIIDFLYENQNKDMTQKDVEKALIITGAIIRKLFEAYYAHPQQLPDGPILHFLVDMEIGKYHSIDEAKEAGIGEARVEFDKIIQNPNIYVECMLMRRICDHIASMTDHYAIEEYDSLYG